MSTFNPQGRRLRHAQPVGEDVADNGEPARTRPRGAENLETPSEHLRLSPPGCGPVEPDVISDLWFD